MPHSCAYCSHAFIQDDDLIWCEEKDVMKSGRQITANNKCRTFEYNSIHVLTEKEYECKVKKRFEPHEDNITKEQIRLF